MSDINQLRKEEMEHLLSTKANRNRLMESIEQMEKGELVEWLKEYRLNLMSLMGQDDYVTGKLDVIKDILDKCNAKEK